MELDGSWLVCGSEPGFGWDCVVVLGAAVAVLAVWVATVVVLVTVVVVLDVRAAVLALVADCVDEAPHAESAMEVIAVRTTVPSRRRTIS